MLFTLRINNVAIIENMELLLGDGLNVLTGETGAGKSIILDALGLVLGNRGSGDFIRTGTEKAVVQATFDISEIAELDRVLKSGGIDREDDDVLILTRELNRSGRHLCRINGQIVPLAYLREIGQLLVDTHTQHEQQTLLTPARQRELLDKFGGEEHQEVLRQYERMYAEWQTWAKRLVSQETDVKERARKIDNLTFQIGEIKAAALKPGEEEELKREKVFLSNAERITNLTAAVYESIYEGSESGSAAVELLGVALNNLGELCTIDPRMKPLCESLEGALYQVEDVARETRAYRDNLEFDAGRLNAIEQRLVDLKSLKRKYGNSVEEVINYCEQATGELAGLQNFGEHTEMLRTETEQAMLQCQELAQRLTTARIQAAAELERMIAQELRELNMQKVRFKILFEKKETMTAGGQEDVEFQLATNPGEPLKPLSKIASGGELSRIILAIKAILAGVDSVPTLVFDEVDTGVGGRALQAVAEKLAKISGRRQVLCITHAAQIASYAQKHYCIEKNIAGDFTRVQINLLDEKEKIDELARMLGGDNISGMARKHARELYMSSQKDAL